jgi:rsbT antagonist protein RsbS
MTTQLQEVAALVLHLWGLVLVPVQGELGDDQWEVLTDRVLNAIATTGAKGLVLDVTGISVIDSHVVSVLGKLARAAELMGTNTTLVGISPAITMTLVEMGIDLPAVHCTLDLEAALEHFGIRYQAGEIEQSPALSNHGRGKP